MKLQVRQASGWKNWLTFLDIQEYGGIGHGHLSEEERFCFNTTAAARKWAIIFERTGYLLNKLVNDAANGVKLLCREHPHKGYP